MQMTSLEPEEALHGLLHAYKRALRAGCREARIDWPPSHIRSMKVLKHMAPCTAHDIARWLRLDKAQIARVLQDLTAAGLVERQVDPDDGRRRILRLSAPGKQLCQRVARVQQATAARMVQGLPE